MSAEIISDGPVHTSAANAGAAQIPSTMQRTDSVQRRNIGIALGVMVFAGALLFLVGLPLLKHWLNVGDIHDVLRKMGLVFYCMSAIALAMAVGAALYARRIFSSDAFPPPGSWVWRDTVIKRGQQARYRGWWVVACAAGFALIAIYLAILPAHVGALSPPPPAHALLPP